MSIEDFENRLANATMEEDSGAEQAGVIHAGELAAAVLRLIRNAPHIEDILPGFVKAVWRDENHRPTGYVTMTVPEGIGPNGGSAEFDQVGYGLGRLPEVGERYMVYFGSAGQRWIKLMVEQGGYILYFLDRADNGRDAVWLLPFPPVDDVERKLVVYQGNGERWIGPDGSGGQVFIVEHHEPTPSLANLGDHVTLIFRTPTGGADGESTDLRMDLPNGWSTETTDKTLGTRGVQANQPIVGSVAQPGGGTLPATGGWRYAYFALGGATVSFGEMPDNNPLQNTLHPGIFHYGPYLAGFGTWNNVWTWTLADGGFVGNKSPRLWWAWGSEQYIDGTTSLVGTTLKTYIVKEGSVRVEVDDTAGREGHENNTMQGWGMGPAGDGTIRGWAFRPRGGAVDGGLGPLLYTINDGNTWVPAQHFPESQAHSAFTQLVTNREMEQVLALVQGGGVNDIFYCTDFEHWTKVTNRDTFATYGRAFFGYIMPIESIAPPTV